MILKLLKMLLGDRMNTRQAKENGLTEKHPRQDGDVSSLIAERERSYVAATTNIFSKFETKLTQAVQLHIGTERPIEWISIERNLKIQNHVFLMGHVKVTPGDVVVTAEGKSVIIDEAVASMYNQVYRLTIPMKLLDSGTAEEIFTYIKDLHTIATHLSNDDLEELLNDAEFDGQRSLLDNPKYQATLDKMTKPQVMCDFQVSELTDQQISALALFSQLGTGTKN